MVSNTFVKALLLVSLGPAVLAQSLNYEQCGGEGWTGPSSCAVGSCCIVSNEFYSQCIPGSCNPTTTIVPRATQIAPAAAPPSIARRASGCGKSPGLTSGTKTITINGKTRRYTLRLPDGYSNSKQYKVIWVYHPSGGTAATTVSSGYNGLLALSSNAKNVIFVAPQGLNKGGEDIAFTDAVNALIDNGLCINPKLRFVTGFSYGGGMTYSIACSRAKVFRAVSVVAGTQLSGCAGGNDPIPYLGIHGVADPTIGVSIGRSLRDKFVRNNGCQATKAPEPAKGAGSSRIKTEFKGCRSGFPVTWIAHGAAHTDLVRDASNKLWIPVETDLFFNQFK